MNKINKSIIKKGFYSIDETYANGHGVRPPHKNGVFSDDDAPAM